MVIDLGAGSSDIVVISLGGITDIETIRNGGDDIDHNIVEKVKELYKVEIGIHEAENAKIAVGMVHSTADFESISTSVIGKSMENNKPKKVDIDSKLVADAAEPIIQNLIRALSLVLERMSPELISGIYNKTIVVGGTSQLIGLKERIFEEVGVPVEISEDPMTVVAKGAAIVAAEPRALEPEVRLKAMK
jgi:rod shape-determining protein MreB